MAKVTTPANPLPPWVNFIKDPDTLTGTNTLRPFHFSKQEMFYYWWNVKSLITSDDEVISFASNIKTEKDLITQPVWFEGGGDIFIVPPYLVASLYVSINFNDCYLDSFGRYWPLMYIYRVGPRATAIIASDPNNLPQTGECNFEPPWPPTSCGTVSVLDKGSITLWLSQSSDCNYPGSSPPVFDASGSFNVHKHWSYS